MHYKLFWKIIESEIGSFLKEHLVIVESIDQYGFRLQINMINSNGIVSFRRLIRAKGSEFATGGVGIVIREVEDIVYELFIRNHLWDSVEPKKGQIITLTDMEKCENKEILEGQLSRKIVSNDHEIVEYANLLKDYLEGYAFPWIWKYSRIESMNELINSMDDVASADWFSPPHMLRKLVVKKLCNDPSYSSYLQFWKERFEGAKELENGRYVPYLNALLDLELVLESY